MYKKLFVATIIIFLLLFAGCSNKDKKVDSTEETKTTNIENSKNTINNKDLEKTDRSLGYIVADKVRVREKDSLNSNVISELNLWTEVEVLGKSNSKQKIGEYEDFWYNIKFGDKSGWCYGALMIYIEEATSEDITQLKNYFNSEDIKYDEAKNILKAIAIATEDVNFTDEGIRKLVALKKEYGNSICNSFFAGIERITFWQYSNRELNDADKIQEEDLKKAVIEANQGGFRVGVLDGDPYLEPLPSFLINDFGEYMSKQMRDYLELKTIEVENNIVDEGFILITWNELGERLANWAIYMKKYPYSKETKIAKDDYYDPYLYIYTHGTYNTPIYDSETGKIDDEVKKSYKNFIKKYEGLDCQQTICEIYDLLKDSKYKKNNKIDEYLTNMFAK